MTGLARRRIVQGAGVATVVAFGGMVWRAWDQGLMTDRRDRAAFSGWRDWRSGQHHGTWAMVAAGILAASPHNTQPWRFVVAVDRIDLHAVEARNLGAFDPYRREMTIGLGCALENVLLAAVAEKFAPSVTLLPNGLADTCVARVDLRQANGSDVDQTGRLASMIGDRHTDRREYDKTRDVSDAALGQLAHDASEPETRLLLFRRETDRGRAFGQATADATRAIVADAEMDGWSKRWTRHARADVDRHRDGLTLAGSGLGPIMRVAGEMLPDQSAASEGGYWLAMTEGTQLPSAAAFGMILVRDPRDRRDALRVGRLWQRLHLRGTELGLAMQPLNQVVEVVDREAELGQPAAMRARLATLVDDPTWRPTFAFRLGYRDGSAPTSPRRSLESVTKT